MCPDSSMLSALFDGELKEERAAEIESHVRSCSACRATMELFASQRELLRSDGAEGGAVPPLESFWEFVGRSRIHRIREPRRLSVPLPMAAAAVVSLAAAVVFNFISIGKKDMPDVLVVESRVPAPTVVSLTVTPGDLDQFLALLEGVDASESEAIHTLPAELPLSRIGEPQMIRPAVLGEAP
jgi:hypothetical protein